MTNSQREFKFSALYGKLPIDKAIDSHADLCISLSFVTSFIKVQDFSSLAKIVSNSQFMEFRNSTPYPYGFLVQIIRLLTVTLKRLILAYPKLVTISFYLLGTFWQNPRKIHSPGGCYIVFKMKCLKKSNL